MQRDDGGPQPRGLYIAAATEAWERFSYYGMNALVMLYMTEALFEPKRILSVYGLEQLRAALSAVYGPLSTQALASQLLGLYAGFVYLTPLLGGFVADRVTGLRRTILAGLIMLSCGHLLMVFDRTFLFALLLLVFGSGLVKGNLSAQVGTLYPEGEQTRRTRGFALFAMGVNVGAICGPLVCGAAVQAFGWHAGFGVAAALMLVSLIIYLAGASRLPDAPRRRAIARRSSLAPGDGATIGLLVVVIAVATFQAAVYSQLFNVGMVWIEEHVDRATALGTVPTPWFNAVDGIASIASAPLLMLLWRAQARRGGEPDALAKIAIGAALTALQALVLAGAASLSGPDKVSAGLVVAVLVTAGIAFNFHWPPLVALISMAAPKPFNALMINLAFLTFFLGNIAAGQLALLYEPLGPGGFWLLHAAVAGAGALLAAALRGSLVGRLGQTFNSLAVQR